MLRPTFHLNITNACDMNLPILYKVIRNLGHKNEGVHNRILVVCDLNNSRILVEEKLRRQIR